MNNRIRTLLIVLAVTILIGVATAPIGIELTNIVIDGETLNVAKLTSMMIASNPYDFWLTESRNIISTPTLFMRLLIWIIALIALLGICVTLGLFGRASHNGEITSGDSRVITSLAEIRRKNDVWNGKQSPKRPGLVIGSTKKSYIYDSAIPHSVVVGKTGSGKTQLVVLPSLHLNMAAGANIIVSGKDELVKLTADKADNLGYQRVVIDLEGFPGASSYNPLDLLVEYVDNHDVAGATETARQIANDIIPLGGENSAFFARAARGLLTALLLVVAYADIPSTQKNMASVCHLVNLGTTGTGSDPTEPLKNYLRSDAVGPDHPAYGPASDFIATGSSSGAGKDIISTMKEGLSIFNDERIKRITSSSDFSIRDCIRDKTIIYLHLLEEGSPYLILFTLFFNQYWRIAQQEASINGGRLPRETVIIGDEWGNIPRVNALPEIVTLGRSMKLHMYCLVQDLKQLNKYNSSGDQNAGRDKLLGSMGCKVALSLGALDDCRYFSALTGKHTVQARSTNSSNAFTNARSSETLSERQDDLIPEWKWQHRVATRDGIIAIKGGENSQPGREGVFQMPITYASKTLAASFFGLGDEKECADKAMEYFARKKEHADQIKRNVDIWIPDFGAEANKKTNNPEIDADEFSAWEV